MPRRTATSPSRFTRGLRQGRQRSVELDVAAIGAVDSVTADANISVHVCARTKVHARARRNALLTVTCACTQVRACQGSGRSSSGDTRQRDGRCP